MKKYSLLKCISIMFLVVIVLTWFIPIGSYSNGEFVTSGTAPVGIFDLSRVPLMTIANLLQYGLIIILIGGLYGVLNKTGVYSNLVDKIVAKLKGKEKLFLIITISVMSLLSSLTGLPYTLLIIVPFLVTLIMKLGFNKIIAFVSTIGAILVGTMGATYGTETSFYINEYFSLGLNDEIFTKFIFLIIITFLLIMFVLKEANVNKNKKESKNEDVIPLYEVNNKKKSSVPLVVIFLLFFILLFINMINWEGLFGITYFSDMYSKMTAVSIGDYPIISNIVGSVSSFGSWSQYDMCIFLALIPFVIGWIYSVKLEDLLDGYTNGIKEVLAPAFYSVIANIIFVTLYRIQSDANIYLTISNFILNLFGGAKLILVPIVSLIGGVFYNDVSTLSSALATPIQLLVTDTTQYQVIGMMIQTLHGFVMLLLPTSILLVTGLSYLKISYKEWIKYIWKYLVQVLIIIIIILIIMAMFI